MKSVHLASGGRDEITATEVAETFASYISAFAAFRQTVTAAGELALAVIEVEDLLASMAIELAAAKARVLELNS